MYQLLVHIEWSLVHHVTIFLRHTLTGLVKIYLTYIYTELTIMGKLLSLIYGGGDSGSNARLWYITDDFSGWKNFLIPIDKP